MIGMHGVGEMVLPPYLEVEDIVVGGGAAVDSIVVAAVVVVVVVEVADNDFVLDVVPPYSRSPYHLQDN